MGGACLAGSNLVQAQTWQFFEVNNSKETSFEDIQGSFAVGRVTDTNNIPIGLVFNLSNSTFINVAVPGATGNMIYGIDGPILVGEYFVETANTNTIREFNGFISTNSGSTASPFFLPILVVPCLTPPPVKRSWARIILIRLLPEISELLINEPMRVGKVLSMTFR